MYNQPPSGGCVLKHFGKDVVDAWYEPAAFRRLCVETNLTRADADVYIPAAFRRLCVETNSTERFSAIMTSQPPSGGCVLKLLLVLLALQVPQTSRLQAAVC